VITGISRGSVYALVAADVSSAVKTDDG